MKLTHSRWKALKVLNRLGGMTPRQLSRRLYPNWNSPAAVTTAEHLLCDLKIGGLTTWQHAQHPTQQHFLIQTWSITDAGRDALRNKFAGEDSPPKPQGGSSC